VPCSRTATIVTSWDIVYLATSCLYIRKLHLFQKKFQFSKKVSVNLTDCQINPRELALRFSELIISPVLRSIPLVLKQGYCNIEVIKSIFLPITSLVGNKNSQALEISSYWKYLSGYTKLLSRKMTSFFSVQKHYCALGLGLE